MWEMVAALIAGLGLAFAVARHSPSRFIGVADGALAVLWPMVAGLFVWDGALIAVALQLKGDLDPSAFSVARKSLELLALPRGASFAVFLGVLGIHVIRWFARPAA